MRTNVKEFMVTTIYAILGFFLGFYSFCGVNFVVTVPFAIYAVSIKRKYLVSFLIGTLLSACILNYKIYPLIIIAIILSAYLLLNFLKKTNISVKNVLLIAGVFSGVVLTAISSYLGIIEKGTIKLILLPILIGVLCMNIINIQYDLKVRENISFTKKQMAFFAFFINILLADISISFMEFELGFVLLFICNYIFTRIDPLIGIVGCLTICGLNLSPASIWAFLGLLPLIYAIKNMRLNRFIRGLSFVGIALLFMVYTKEYHILLESLIVFIGLITIEDSFINTIHKYVVEPQDYELKLYQKSYYKCLNRNKKIQKVMGILEECMKSNSKMSKNTKDILFKNLEFLSNKLKEEDNIKIKEQIRNELYYNKLEILGFKIIDDYFNNYKIYFEIADNANIEDFKLIEIFQEHLKARLKILNKSTNSLINSVRYEMGNDEKISFQFAIKQRSKEDDVCGDSYINFNTKNKKYFLISDGMGHGKRAGKESSQALCLLRDLIELQMQPQDAILTTNALLFDRQNEQFNTLDLLEYDTFEQKIYLYKNGSGTTYLKNIIGVEKVSSNNLPLGIVEDIKVEKLEISLDNDFIILTSDGFKKDFSSLIENTKIHVPKDLAEEILEYEGNIIEDDQTIVVINVIKNY